MIPNLPPLGREAAEIVRAALETAHDAHKTADATDLLMAIAKHWESGLETWGIDAGDLAAAFSFVNVLEEEASGPSIDWLLATAQEDAARRGSDETAPEDLLVAIMRAQGTVASAILDSMDVKVGSVDGSETDVRGGNGSARTVAAMRRLSPGEVAHSERDWKIPDRGDPRETNLVRVISVQDRVAEGAVVVEFLMVEVREGGLILHWRAATPAEETLEGAELTVECDRGLVAAETTLWESTQGRAYAQTDIWPDDYRELPSILLINVLLAGGSPGRGSRRASARIQLS